MNRMLVISDEELQALVEKASAGTLSKLYDVEHILEFMDEYLISKHEVVNVYFDDILNCLEPNEDIVKYINELIEKWGV